MLMLKSRAFHKPFEPDGGVFRVFIWIPLMSCLDVALLCSVLGVHAFIQEELEMKCYETETCTALDLQSTALYWDIYPVSFFRGI